MSKPAVAYFDHGGLDGVYVSVDTVLDKLPLTSESKRSPIPEDFMDRLEKLLGDGRATLTYGLDVKTNEDFGNAAGCSVFVKLTCDQSEAVLDEARIAAHEIAERFVAEGQLRAKRILDGARGIINEEPAPEATKPAPAASKPRVVPKKAEASSTEVDPEPRAQAVKPAGKKIMLKKPNFRR
jgi:hypothetical protein